MHVALEAVSTAVENVPMKPRPYVKWLAERLTCELTANGELSKITRNPALIGAFAEATIRQLVRRFVFPLRVSRGSILYERNCKSGTRDEPPEIDTIIWSPCPLPPVFESGDVALVPRGSAFAMLEIKSTNYSGAADAIRKTLDRERELMQWPLPDGRVMVGGGSAMGVVCVRARETDRKLDKLIHEKSTVQILRLVKDKYVPCPNSIFRLVNFLAAARKRAKDFDGTIRIPETWFDS